MNPGRRARIETEERFMIPALTIDELQMQAQRRLPKPIYDFIDGAAYDEATKVANRQDFLSLRLRQRVLRDIAVRDHGTTILGQKSSMPAMISPVGMSGLLSPRKPEPRRPVLRKPSAYRSACACCLPAPGGKTVEKTELQIGHT